jgi:hypothetical protein
VNPRFSNPADLVEALRVRFRAELDDILLARLQPDGVGMRYAERYLGHPLSALHVSIDLPGNALHVRTEGTDPQTQRVTLTYFPAWLLHLLLDPELAMLPKLMPVDFERAVPLRITMRGARAAREPPRTAPTPGLVS